MITILSRHDYDAIDEVNFSTLQHIDRSPAHYKWHLENSENMTEACRFGIVYHLCVFEPGRFETVEVCQFDSFRTKDAREWRDAHRVYLKGDEREKCHEMRDALLRHPVAKEMLEAQGKTECVFQWKDADTGIACKTRLDKFLNWQGWPVVFDLKSCTDASAEAFTKHAYDMKYHIRCSWTLAALNTLAECERRYIFAAQEKEPPYAVQLHELDDDFVAKGNRWRSWLKKLKECRETGNYEAYKSGVETLEAKPWMR